MASVQDIIDEATFEFTMGESAAALRQLREATERFPDSPELWHAIAEMAFDTRDLDRALEAGNRAIKLREEDVHFHTTLSRIHMERGDKETAEQHGARARVLGWKSQLEESEDDN